MHNQDSFKLDWYHIFSNFTCMFLNPNSFFNLNSNCSNLLDMSNLLEQVKKAFCHHSAWINCSSEREKLLKFGAEGREFANIWDHQNNSFKQWKVRTISG